MKRHREDSLLHGEEEKKPCFNWKELLPELQNEVRLRHCSSLEQNLLAMTCREEAAIAKASKPSPGSVIYHISELAAFYGYASLMHWLTGLFPQHWAPEKALHPFIEYAIRGHQSMDFIRYHCMMYGFMPKHFKLMLELSVEVDHEEIYQWITLHPTLPGFILKPRARSMYTLQGAIKANRENVVSIAEAALQEMPSMHLEQSTRLMKLAIKTGNHFVFKAVLTKHLQVLQHYNHRRNRYLYDEATIDMLRYYLRISCFSLSIFKDLVNAMRHFLGGDGTIEWLADWMLNNGYNGETLSPLLRWLVEEKNLAITPRILELAWYGGCHEFLDWLLTIADQ